MISRDIEEPGIRPPPSAACVSTHGPNDGAARRGDSEKEEENEGDNGGKTAEKRDFLDGEKCHVRAAST